MKLGEVSEMSFKTSRFLDLNEMTKAKHPLSIINSSSLDSRNTFNIYFFLFERESKRESV